MNSCSFGRRKYFTVENAGLHSALFSFGTEEVSRSTIVVTAADGKEHSASQAMPSFFGRISVEGLNPGREYTARLLSLEGAILGELSFRTAACPGSGAYTAPAFAVIADPHISLNRENKRGRMYSESGMILRTCLEDAYRAGCGAVLMPGDITDTGTAEESRLAADILSSFPGEVFAVPGDHDSGSKRGDPGNDHFPRINGRNFPFSALWNDIRIIGLDTSDGRLDTQQLQFLKAALTEAGKTVILSHHELIRDEQIQGNTAAVENVDETEEVLRGGRSGWILYCGHKNVPLVREAGKGIQLHVPQPVQYPAGFLIARDYGSELLHSFRPIRSEALRWYSLLAMEADGSPAYRPAYRYGSLSGRSFCYSWPGSSRSSEQ